LLDGSHHTSRARRGLIRRAWLQDDYATIEQHALTLLAADPDDLEVLLDLARVHRGQGRYDEKLTLLDGYAVKMNRSARPTVLGEQAECLRLHPSHHDLSS
jgi:thioredoxin-like negative regulator of GroEL